VGSRLLVDASRADKLAEENARARANIDLAEQAIQAARHERLVAIPRVWAAEATLQRTKASEVRIEPDAAQAESDRLRQALQEHLGCRYVVYTPAVPPPGVAADMQDWSLPRYSLPAPGPSGWRARRRRWKADRSHRRARSSVTQERSC
jgi:hypothetical protein